MPARARPIYLYEQAYHPAHPRVCFDETIRQLIEETRQPLPAKPGQVQRYDYEYKRNGTRNLFLFFEPLAGWRHIDVTEHRTKVDFAHQMRWLVDVAYPDVECIDVILDNLNTHTYGALYEAFEPAEARRIARKLVFHYTPKHASWLNMAEIEFSVISRKLGPRVPNEEALKQKVKAIEASRNLSEATVDWQFTTDDARIKLKRLYPSYSE
jgi:transposase